MRLTTLAKKLLRWDLAAFLALSCLSALQASDANFFVMDGHQSTIFVNGPVARAQNMVFYVTCWVTLVIFIIVGGVLGYVTLKYKARSAGDEHAEPPPQSHGNPLVEIGLIAASVFALVIIAIPTLQQIWYTYDVPNGETRQKLDGLVKAGDAYEVNVTGLQWWFKFEYPTEQITGTGALSVANELVIPAGIPIRLNLRGADVIHSFWVPKLGGKVDMIPNRANFLWLQADEPGYFWGQCAEYCGDSHAVMRFRVIALDKKAFAEWRDNQVLAARSVAPKTAATGATAQFAALRSFKMNEIGFSSAWDANAAMPPLELWKQKQFPEKDEDSDLIAKGRQLFQSKTCQNCHTIRGHGPAGVTAPDLTHFGARTTLAAGLLENNDEQLRRWIHNPGAVKAGNKMYMGIGAMAGYMKKDEHGKLMPNIVLSDAEEVALVSYLHSLK
jgi:cytochrome c oxidase subunit II